MGADARVKGKSTLRVVWVLLATIVSSLAAGTADAACPPNASASYQSGNVVHCKCNAGYESRDGACKLIPTMHARPEPAMRPISRAQCLKFQETIRRDGLAGCKSNLYYCMVERGSGFPAAWCAVGVAKAGFSANLAGVTAAIISCGEKAQKTYTACEPKMTACTDAIKASYPAGVASCPRK